MTPQADTVPDPAQTLTRRFAAVFAEEERSGLLLSMRIRMLIFFLILVWYVVDELSPLLELNKMAYISAFFFLGMLQYGLARQRLALTWFPYLLAAIDAVLLALIMIGTNPFLSVHVPEAMTLRDGGVIFLLIFLIPPVFSYRWRLVVWTGACMAITWVSLLAFTLSNPRTFVLSGERLDGSPLAQQMAMWSNPYFVNITSWASELVVLIIITGGLAVAVYRSRQLVAQQAIAERARTNLARYFSPQVLEELQGRDEPIGQPRSQDAAVMFLDIVGFTTLAERRTPEHVMKLLRRFCELVERHVFAHEGTLEKFLGDGAMAVFGVPRGRPDDAVRALDAANDMLDELDEWNVWREENNLPPLAIGIGLHFGRVVAGDVGSERTKSFTIIGDTVNTASRIEGLTRKLGCSLLVSNAFVDAARAASPDHKLLAELQNMGAHEVKGRVNKIVVWGHGRLRQQKEDSTLERFSTTEPA